MFFSRRINIGGLALLLAALPTAAQQATRDISYVTSTEKLSKAQRLDVFQSGGGAPHPVLVYVHGGGWNHGEKPKTAKPFETWMDAGFSVVSVEYRLVDEAPAPAALQDVRCALSWVQANAAAYHFDLSRVVLYGASAGAHLALLAAVLPAKNDFDLPSCNSQPKIAAVLDFFGPYHLESNVEGAYGGTSTKRWMGENPIPNLRGKEKLMSPATYVRAGLPPIFIVHGDADPTVPYRNSVMLHQDLDRLSVPNEFHTVPGGLHGRFGDETEKRIELQSLQFLQAQGVLKEP